MIFKRYLGKKRNGMYQTLKQAIKIVFDLLSIYVWYVINYYKNLKTFFIAFFSRNSALTLMIITS